MGRNAMWEKTSESEPGNAAPEGNGEPLKGAQQGSDIITFVVFLFLKGLLTAGLWQPETREKRL